MWREQCDKQREEIHENTSLFTVLATFGVSVVWRCPTSTSDYLRSVHHPSPGQNRQYKPFRLVSVPLSCGQKQSISVTDGAPMFRGRCKYNYFIIIFAAMSVVTEQIFNPKHDSSPDSSVPLTSLRCFARLQHLFWLLDWSLMRQIVTEEEF